MHLTRREEGGGEKRGANCSMSKTHFLVYGLKTSRLIVQALIQFCMLIVILRTRQVVSMVAIFRPFDFITGARISDDTVII